MKKITLILSAALLVAALPSCKSTQKVAPKFDTVEKEQNFRTTTGNFRVTYRFEYLSSLADQTVLHRVQKEMAAEFFGPEYTRPTLAETLTAFDSSLEESYGTRPESTDFKWDGFLTLHSKADMVGEHILTYTVERAEFAGGAHGMEQTHHANWNLLTGERLTLDDLFTPEGKAALAEAIRAQIIKDKGVTSWQELAEGQCFNPEAEVTATENFALTASDITFVYNPYDIACYAAGATHVKLPLANLAGFRKEIL
jgi:hypothetical protein